MIYRMLGGTGLKLSVLGLGTVKLGRNTGVKYPEAFAIPDDDAARNLLATARDLGINMLDTAPAYGESEIRLGGLLAGSRGDWILCTKAGEQFDPVTGDSHYDFTPEALQASVQRSLRRLRTDYLDLLLIHSNGEDERIIRELGALEVLADLKKQGLIRVSGMSTKTVAGGLLALENADCAMVTLNSAHVEELPVIEQARKLGKGILIKKVLASGQMARGAQGQDPVRAAFRLALEQPAVTSIVTGTINPSHLRHNAEVADRVCRELEAAKSAESARDKNRKSPD